MNKKRNTKYQIFEDDASERDVLWNHDVGFKIQNSKIVLVLQANQSTEVGNM